MRVIAVLLVVVACRGDRHERVAPRTHVASSGSGSAQLPQDSGELVAVPPEIAGKVALREIAHGLQRPVLATFAPGDARHRMFVVEQRGAIVVIEAGRLAPKPFFNIGGLSDGNEEGLLGLAFAPDYASSSKLYVNYTSRDMATHVVEYRVAPGGDAVDPKTARELVRIDQPYSNHNGGNLVFGPDGRLYTGIGDGGAANDPHRNGQNPHALLGKILRFDGDQPQIVHNGMRNPWRFSFDTNGDLYIGDVGQNLWEEIDVAPAGSGRLNFGWNIMEGTHCFDADTGQTRADCDRTGLTLPVAEYPHDEGCSVTGGLVYRGKALPALQGRYFYADYCTGLLRSFRYAAGAIHDHWDWKPAIDPDGALTQVSSFGTDADGEMYIVELTGAIYELVPK